MILPPIPFLLVIYLVESKKFFDGQPVVRSLSGRVNRLSAGSRIGFNCKRVQRPLFRSPIKRGTVIFESVTIIKYTRVIVSGEIVFDLVCTRDPSSDQGDVAPPEDVEEEVTDIVEEPDDDYMHDKSDQGGFSNADMDEQVKPDQDYVEYKDEQGGAVTNDTKGEEKSADKKSTTKPPGSVSKHPAKPTSAGGGGGGGKTKGKDGYKDPDLTNVKLRSLQ